MDSCTASPYFPEADCMIDHASLVGMDFLIRWLHTTVSVSVSVITCCKIIFVSAPLTLTSIVSSDIEAENVRITFSIVGSYDGDVTVLLTFHGPCPHWLNVLTRV